MPEASPSTRAPSLLAAAALVASALAPVGARAHDLWLEPQGEALVLRYGHHGGELLDLDAAKVKVVRCRRAGAPAADVRGASTTTPKELRTPWRCDVASAFLDGGFWSLTPDGERNLPRSEVPDAVRSWQPRQFAKWIDVRSASAGTALGDELEIVPVGDLSRARQGDKATFRVLWQGKPVAGAILAIDHRPLGETDAAGECRVKVRAADVESVSVTLKRPLGIPEADLLVAEASLTFEVAR
jgi:nickel transport protein